MRSNTGIFDWVKKNMSLEKAHHVFYDEDRAEDYKGLEPDRPKDENCYEPFLSPKFLTQVLIKMGIVRESTDEDSEDDVEVIDLCSSSDDDESSKSDLKVVPIKTNSTTKKRQMKVKSLKKAKRSVKTDSRSHKWQIDLDGHWKDFDNYTSTILESAFVTGRLPNCHYTLGKWRYVLDFHRMLQINTRTNKSRPVRRVPS